MFLYIIIIILAGLVAFHIRTRYSRMGRLLNKIPGPPEFPFLGNLLQINVSSEKLVEVLKELMTTYYPTVRIWLCTTALVGIRHPDDCEILLSSQKTIDKGYAYDYIMTWLKTGLLTSTGDLWRVRRKILTPAFHFQILKKYLEITNEQVDKMIASLRAEGSETIQSLLPLTSTFTLNIICEAAMGVSLDKMDKKEVKEYTTAIQEFGEVVAQRSVKPYIQDWMMGPLLHLGRLQAKALNILYKFTDKVLRDRREYHKSVGYKYLQEIENSNGGESQENEYLGRKKRLAMLDLLLLAENKGQIDEEGIKEEVDTFTFEGHDTTGMALTFTLMLLAENKEAQEKARQEVRDLLKKNGGPLSSTNLQELTYIERCIKESLRLYPSVPTIMRCLTEDLQLKNYIVPAGTSVICFIKEVHHDPKFWPEPEKFDPDRFLPERSVNRHPYSYLPFSAGPRNCIGQKFAMMELKALVAKILLAFELEPVDRLSDVKFKTDLVIRPAHPIHLKFVQIREK